MKIDSAGTVCCCGRGGVHVLAPDAACLGVIRMPEHSANLCFGDDDLKSLYVTLSTSSRRALKAYTFGTGVAQHTFCSNCGMHAFYIPRSQPHRVLVNARCLDDIDGPSLKPTRFFDGRHWEDAQRLRIAETGHAPPLGAHGAKTLQAILDRAGGVGSLSRGMSAFAVAQPQRLPRRE